MSAPQETTPTPISRGELRLRLAERPDRPDGPGQQRLDGGWWPYSRDLTLEMRELVRHFPPERGRIVRALFSRPDWDTAPTRVDLGTRYLKVGSFPRDDTHVLEVQTARRDRLTLLVIPPDFTAAQADEAMLAATTSGNAHSGTEVLAEVTDHHDPDPADYWTDSAEAATPTQ